MAPMSPLIAPSKSADFKDGSPSVWVSVPNKVYSAASQSSKILPLNRYRLPVLNLNLGGKNTFAPNWMCRTSE
jgi:hypothetical protein